MAVAAPASVSSVVSIPWPVRRRVAMTIALGALAVAYQFAFQVVPLKPHRLADPPVVVALALIAVGLLIRSWAAGVIVKCTELARNGPYALVRHPLYAGTWLMIVGFAVLSGSWFSVVLAIGPLAWIYLRTIAFEEATLAKRFGSDWTAYAARTPRLVPWRPGLGALRSQWSLRRFVINGEQNAWLGAIVGIGLLLAGGLLWW